MKDEYVPIQELEKLSHFLHGAHSACDHENIKRYISPS